jgi:hypothetical protein
VSTQSPIDRKRITAIRERDGSRASRDSIFSRVAYSA